MLHFFFHARCYYSNAGQRWCTAMVGMRPAGKAKEGTRAQQAAVKHTASLRETTGRNVSFARE